jgi:hypothetical protein
MAIVTLVEPFVLNITLENLSILNIAPVVVMVTEFLTIFMKEVLITLLTRYPYPKHIFRRFASTFVSKTWDLVL